MRHRLCAVAGAVLFSSSCATPSVVFLVPVDAAPELIDDLAGYYRENLKLDVQILDPVEVNAEAFDRERRQYVAEELIELLRDTHGVHAKSGPVIGVTSGDMYIKEVRWQFAFSRRQAPYAIVSYARMDPRRLGEMAGRERLLRRLRKMTTRNIGVLVYRIRMTPDPTSLMYQEILGVDDLDRIDEDLVRAGFPVAPPAGS